MVTNPPPIRVPQEFAKDRNTFAYFNELHTFLRLLWERTGGGTDAISEAGESNDAAAPMFSHAARIAALGLDVDSVERTAFLGLSTPDKAQIEAVRAEIGKPDVFSFTPDNARYGSVTVELAEIGTTAGMGLATLPLLAKVGGIDDRLTEAEEDIAAIVVATADDPLLAYSALPDKAAISALRDDVTAVDRAMVALQPLHAKLAADSTRLDAHEALNEAYFAYFEILLNLVADVANTQFMLAGPPLAGRVAALSEQVTATNILAFPGPDSARYAALVEQLKDEVQNLRVEIAALYSDRAKLAHLDNRVNDMELISWL